MVKLSKAGKMPCKSFSLQALDTCPGAYDDNGQIKDVCSGCYATKGAYRWPAVEQVRIDNYEETLKDSFVPDMVELLNKQRNKHFRWFDSGDVYSQKFLMKVYSICLKTPQTKHWIPTKSRELFSQCLWGLLEALPNVKVRYSSPSINGYSDSKHGATVIQVKDNGDFARKISDPKKLFVCPSSNQKGKCKDCRACWSKKIEVIAYVKH